MLFRSPALPSSPPAAAGALPSSRGRPPRRGAASAQAGGVGAEGPAMAASELYTKVRRPASRAVGGGRATRRRRPSGQGGAGARGPGAAPPAPPPSRAFQNPDPCPWVPRRGAFLARALMVKAAGAALPRGDSLVPATLLGREQRGSLKWKEGPCGFSRAGLGQDCSALSLALGKILAGGRC